MLKKRTVINQIEVLASGDIQVREGIEIYDDAITVVAFKAATHNPAGKEMTPEVQAVTDVESQKYHRYVVPKSESTPADVQAFLDNSKA